MSLRTKLGANKRATLIFAAAIVVIFVAAAIITVIITGGNVNQNPNTMTTVPPTLVTDPGKVTTVTPIPKTTPGGTPIAVTTPPPAPSITVTEKPRTGNSTKLKSIGGRYSTTDQALALSAASTGYGQYCTQTAGESTTARATRLSPYFLKGAAALTTPLGMKTQSCAQLNATTTGLYANNDLNVFLLEHATGTRTNGVKVNTSYSINLRMRKVAATWRIVSLMAIAEKK